ncbi:MAG TPA: PEP/pyruvate-binding domain-containing protein [Steroidobacteraceae bacterium]
MTGTPVLDAGEAGPKAANLAALAAAGLPVPDGFCVGAQAYRAQLAALGVQPSPLRATDDAALMRARREAIAIRLALLSRPIAAEILEPMLGAWRALCARSPGAATVVRSSSLVEDRFGSSFAGQFESYLGLENEADFLTAVRACWAALWAPRILRYMLDRDASPADTAMAVLVQPLIAARISGGGLSDTGAGDMMISATWGLGSAIAQGEVVPDRYVLSRSGELRSSEAGRKSHAVGCRHHGGAATQVLRGGAASALCLDARRLTELAGYLQRAKQIMGRPVEIEWALDDRGFKLLQSRPLPLLPAHLPDAIWLGHPAVRGQPAGVGWGTGRACVVNCECELSRVGPGDVLVTKVAGPALGRILARVTAVVSELGGSTSHLASLARERGIPMVLGVHHATERIPDGRPVAVDGVAGIVRWMS